MKKNGKKKEQKAAPQWIIPSQPDQDKIRREAAPLLRQTADFKIISEEHWNASAALVERHDEAIRIITERFNPFVSGLHKLHKDAIALRDSFLDPIVKSRGRLLTSRMEYRKQMEERKRKADEAAAKKLAAQHARDCQKAAKLAERDGNTEVAEQYRMEAGKAPRYFSDAPAVEKQDRNVVREGFDFEYTDKDLVPRELCSPDDKKVRERVNAFGLAANIPGVTVREKTTEYFTARK